MDVQAWLESAQEDATRREMPELIPLLAGLATSTQALRDADEALRLLVKPADTEGSQDQ
jgi:hypothetical protein